jgi:SdrD B-like domain/Secretion system C-terminal sorting domain
MKKISTLLLAIVLIAFNTNTFAQVSGNVFRDYNGDGAKTVAIPTDIGIAGMTVKAFSALEVLLGTTTTDASGNYSFTAIQIPAGTAVRIEFTAPASSTALFPTSTGLVHGSNVQFLTAPSSTLSTGFNSPKDFVASADLQLIIPQHWGQVIPNGGPGAGLPIAQQKALMVFQESWDGNATGFAGGGGLPPGGIAPPSIGIATVAQIGTTWGVAMHKPSKNVFTSAFVRRYGNFGPDGGSAIYKVGAGVDGIFGNGDDVAPSLFVKLDNYFGANSTGTTFGPLADDTSNACAKTGFGDIEMSADGSKLFAMNLFDKKIYTIPVNATASTPGVGTITASATYPTPSPSYGIIRPFGMAVNNDNGKVYVTATVEGNNADGHFYVWGYDPTTNAWDAAPIVDYTFVYYAGGPCCYEPWLAGVVGYAAQLVATGIDFDPSGKFLNIAYVQRRVYAQDIVGLQSRNTGNILRFCNTAGTWSAESGGVACGITGSSTTNGQGPGGGEFYFDSGADGPEVSIEGGALQIPGRPYFTAVLDDPFAVYSSGVAHMTNANGGSDHRYEIKSSDYSYPPPVGSLDGKLNPLGDIEYVSLTPAPIEIGNRIWNDVNGNGIQNAGEVGIANVTLELFNPGTSTVVGTVTTDANGSWYFSSAAGTSVAGATYGVNILPATNYIVRIKTGAAFDWNAGVGINDLAGKKITLTGVSGIGTAGFSDNDGALVSGVPQISVTTGASGQNNFNLDFGFKGTQSLGNKVWLDMGAGGGTAKNGIQDGTEPGVASVPVDLYTTGVDGLAGTADDVLVASTITDAYGMYLFNDLPANTGLFIKVTPPANYNFSTQTNTTDDNLTSGISVTGSDVNILGTSYIVILSPDENNLNIDAGLIFGSPVALSSIGNQVWFDTNGDGTNANGPTEPGVAGVTVTLYDVATGNIVAVTTTDAGGFYLFNNLPNGSYQVGFSAPGGTVLTTGTGTGVGTPNNSDANPATGRTGTIVIAAAGTVVTDIDAGLRNDTKGAIGDYVWNDLANFGVQDAGEPGVPGVTMRLYGPGPDNVAGGGDDVLLATTTTDANGYYIFPNLDPARYFVVATPVAGYNLTTTNTGNDTKDNDFAAGVTTYAGSYVSPVYILLPVAGGVTRDMTVDLGIRTASAAVVNSLGNKVWNDLNNDGLQTAGEAGVPNVTVRLLNNLGVAVNNPTTGKPYVVTTDTLGNYKFVQLPDGLYIVEFANLPSGFTFTNKDAAGSGAPGSPTDTDTDSDASTTTGRTAIIDLGTASAIPVDEVKVDAGIVQGTPAGTGSLGNRVWYDNVTVNGLQDAGELGVAKVQVTLLDGTGAVVNVPGTSTPYIIYTNALGEYLFTNLPAGDYQVRFANFPIGYTAAPADAGNDALDADATFAGMSMAATTATTATYTLKTGEDNLTVDMGIRPAAGTNSLGDFVWNDLNGDGIQTAGEPGVQGVTVTLYAADGVTVLGVTTTDINGKYTFVGLADATYIVGFSNFPAGFTLTGKNVGGTGTDSDADPITGKSAPVALAGGVPNTTIDAGLQSSTAALGNFVWLDTNGDGVQDATEKGISGVTVILYATDGTTVLASTMTDADGKYYFANLAPGSYRVGFSTVPTDLMFTQQNGPGDNGTLNNSDAIPVSTTVALTGTVVLSAKETDLTIDAGLKPNNFASVGNYVWLDLNADGKQDPTEPGVPGVIVTLYDLLDNPIGTAVTDGNGKYLITNIPAAAAGTSYYVKFSNLPATAIFTTRSSDVTPGDATAGSDADPTAGANLGRTANFTLTPGQYLPTVDAGLRNIKLLPIKIASFTAVPKGTAVDLQWSVSEQTDVVKYEVLFSVDGKKFNKTIATVASNNALTAKYSAVHFTPVSGANFYRIKTTEIDGTVSYSEIRTVTFGKDGQITVYPNPTSIDNVSVSLKGSMTGKPATISIISMDGKVVASKKYTTTNQTEYVDVSNLASGSYIVRVATDAEIVNTTLQVIK